MEILQQKKEFECSRCGWCCQHVIYNFKKSRPYTPDTLQWMKARGITIKGNQIIIPSLCQYLRFKTQNEDEGDIESSCEIHTNKPRVCQKMKCTKIPGVM